MWLMCHKHFLKGRVRKKEMALPYGRELISFPQHGRRHPERERVSILK